MATETKTGRMDRAAEAADKYVTHALLWSAIAWAFSFGAILMHVSGVGNVVTDGVALGLSLWAGMVWAVVIFLANW